MRLANRQPPFRPSGWCRGPHAQTIWGSILRPAPRVLLRRERWETPDGDFVDVDWTPGPPMAPILIVLPGLEGSSQSKPVMGLLAAAYRKGWRGLGVNFRSCSGEPNRLRRSYHGGETSDLRWIISRLIQENPRRPLLCAGISLGGNILLKYLGEEGEALPEQVRGAAAISAPFDLKASALYLGKGFSRVYMRRLVRSLKGKALAKLERYPGLADRRKLLSVRTLKEFDDLVTGPVHGFRDAQAYWAASSSAQFLSEIRRPVLLINARDDPFLPEQALPEKEVSDNHFITAEFPKKGGHVGFLSGRWPGRPIPWAEIQAIRFLEESLGSSQGG
ncbi:MAG: alpha/beta fold hydrolase [Candidatus Omnitrophica bacterium]|nr:alpha/beta fold hydrolase [Candidatus Omnitrophota bacterium]